MSCFSTEDQIDEIYTWLNQTTFSKRKKNIARDFSNGVFMAELIKKYYPRYVDLHNYSNTNSLTSKIDNWRTLNKKVLPKLNIKISDTKIYQIATSQDTNAIEDLLIKVRNRILKGSNDERSSLYSSYEDDKEIRRVESILDFNEVRNRTVSKTTFLKVKQELEEKNERIIMLKGKLSHLENLIRLKNQRIADLTSEIMRLEMR